jgi:DNA-binding GntR family transcriptional regulator
VARDLDDVAYLRIAGILRAAIASGQIPPGGRLPSETQLMIRHRVSRSVAKWAITVLKADGLVDGRQGAGVFVRSPLRLVRRPQQAGHLSSVPSRSQPDADDYTTDPWPYRVDKVRAEVDLAERLVVPLDTPLVRTRYRLAGSGPQQLVTSWQPAEIPCLAAHRLAERVIVRPARPDEIEALGLPARGCVLHIARTYTTDSVPIETADMVLAVDQVELHYEFPIN